MRTQLAPSAASLQPQVLSSPVTTSSWPDPVAGAQPSGPNAPDIPTLRGDHAMMPMQTSPFTRASKAAAMPYGCKTDERRPLDISELRSPVLFISPVALLSKSTKLFDNSVDSDGESGAFALEFPHLVDPRTSVRSCVVTRAGSESAADELKQGQAGT